MAVLETVFLKLVNLSIAAGYLILAVLLLRFLLKKAPRWVHCLLWGLVGLRLIFPFSIESVFSLIPSAETVSKDALFAEVPSINSGVAVVDRLVDYTVQEVRRSDPGTVSPMQALTDAAAIIWLVGAAGLLLYSLVSYWLLRRRMAGAVRLRDNLWQSEAVISPFILGVFRPRIYLPFGMEERTLVSVEAHERAHLKRRDHWIKPFAFFLLCVYWFHPLMWVAYVLLCRDIELACDERVIRSLDEDARRDYASALLECGVGRRRIAACPLAFGEGGVKARIKSVMNYKKPAFWIILAAVVCVVAVSVCFLTVPQTEELPRLVNMQVTAVGSDYTGVSIKPTVYKPGMHLTVEWKNNSLQTVTRGYGYSLYYRVEKEWEPVPTKDGQELAFISLATEVPVFGQDYQEHDLEVYEIFGDGVYRYETTFSVSGKSYTAWFEYTIQYSNGLTGEYRMTDIPEQYALEYLLLPRLYLDGETKEFSIVHDYASSYLITGGYTFEDNLLVCTTSDGRYTYRFRRQEDGSFVFLQDGSDTLKPHDERLAPEVTDGAVFVYVPEDPPVAATATTEDCTPDGECEVHRMEYHNVDSALFSLIPQAEFDAFTATYRHWSIVDIVKEFDISRQEFTEAMGITADNRNEPLYDSSDDWLTKGEYVEAVYSDDPTQRAAAFKRPTVASLSEAYQLVVSAREDAYSRFTPKDADYTVSYSDVYEVAVYNGREWVDLKSALLDGSVTMEQILQKAEADVLAGNASCVEYKDGGSRMYRYPSHTILKLNTLAGDRRVFIGDTDFQRPTVAAQTTQSTTAS